MEDFQKLNWLDQIPQSQQTLYQTEEIPLKRQLSLPDLTELPLYSNKNYQKQQHHSQHSDQHQENLKSEENDTISNLQNKKELSLEQVPKGIPQSQIEQSFHYASQLDNYIESVNQSKSSHSSQEKVKSKSSKNSKIELEENYQENVLNEFVRIEQATISNNQNEQSKQKSQSNKIQEEINPQFNFNQGNNSKSSGYQIQEEIANNQMQLESQQYQQIAMNSREYNEEQGKLSKQSKYTNDNQIQEENSDEIFMGPPVFRENDSRKQILIDSYLNQNKIQKQLTLECQHSQIGKISKQSLQNEIGISSKQSLQKEQDSMNSKINELEKEIGKILKNSLYSVNSKINEESKVLEFERQQTLQSKGKESQSKISIEYDKLSKGKTASQYNQSQQDIQNQSNRKSNIQSKQQSEAEQIRKELSKEKIQSRQLQYDQNQKDQVLICNEQENSQNNDKIQQQSLNQKEIQEKYRNNDEQQGNSLNNVFKQCQQSEEIQQVNNIEQNSNKIDSKANQSIQTEGGNFEEKNQMVSKTSKKSEASKKSKELDNSKLQSSGYELISFQISTEKEEEKEQENNPQIKIEKKLEKKEENNYNMQSPQQDLSKQQIQQSPSLNQSKQSIKSYVKGEYQQRNSIQSSQQKKRSLIEETKQLVNVSKALLKRVYEEDDDQPEDFTNEKGVQVNLQPIMAETGIQYESQCRNVCIQTCFVTLMNHTTQTKKFSQKDKGIMCVAEQVEEAIQAVCSHETKNKIIQTERKAINASIQTDESHPIQLVSNDSQQEDDKQEEEEEESKKEEGEKIPIIMTRSRYHEKSIQTPFSKPVKKQSKKNSRQITKKSTKRSNPPESLSSFYNQLEKELNSKKMKTKNTKQMQRNGIASRLRSCDKKKRNVNDYEILFS